MRPALMWFAIAGTLVVIVRAPRLIDLLSASESMAPSLFAVVLPLGAIAALRWSRRRETPVSLAQLVARNRRAMFGLTIVGTLVAVAILAPILTSYDPNVQPDVVNLSNKPPSWAHPFGTDGFSRDLASRVLYGARYTLSIAIVSVVVMVTIGTGVGMIAGLAGGATDTVLMRFVDAGLAIPRIFLLMVMIALWDDMGVVALVAVLALSGWFGTSRLVRAEVLALRSREFIEAARAGGVARIGLVLRHILPNAASPIIVNAALAVGNIVLIEAALSYLGIGLRSPTPTWGNIIREGYVGGALTAAPWISTIPGLAIVVTVLGFSLLGDGLRESLDPRHR